MNDGVGVRVNVVVVEEVVVDVGVRVLVGVTLDVADVEPLVEPDTELLALLNDVYVL